MFLIEKHVSSDPGFDLDPVLYLGDAGGRPPANRRRSSSIDAWFCEVGGTMRLARSTSGHPRSDTRRNWPCAHDHLLPIAYRHHHSAPAPARRIGITRRNESGSRTKPCTP